MYEILDLLSDLFAFQLLEEFVVLLLQSLVRMSLLREVIQELGHYAGEHF